MQVRSFQEHSPKTTSLGDSTNIRKTGSMNATCYLCPPSYLTGLMQAANRSGSRVPSSAAREIKWPGDCLYMDVIWHMEFIFWIWPVFREVPASEGYTSNLRPCTAMLCAQVAAACSPSASSSSASTRGSCCSETCFPRKNATKETHCFTLLHIACWRFHKNLCGFQLQVGLRGHLFSQEAFRLTFLQPPSFWDFTLETKANVLYIYNVHLYVYITIHVYILYTFNIHIHLLGRLTKRGACGDSMGFPLNRKTGASGAPVCQCCRWRDWDNAMQYKNSGWSRNSM